MTPQELLDIALQAPALPFYIITCLFVFVAVMWVGISYNSVCRSWAAAEREVLRQIKLVKQMTEALNVRQQLHREDKTQVAWLEEELKQARYVASTRRKRIERAIKRANTKSPNNTVRAMCAILVGDRDGVPYDAKGKHIKPAHGPKLHPLDGDKWTDEQIVKAMANVAPGTIVDLEV